MYPQQSSAVSGSPGSLWWKEALRGVDGQLSGGHRIVATQWDALVRRFQTRGAALIGPVFGFSANGDCASISGVLRTNIRRRDQIDVDGVFGPESRDLLGYLLCSAGGTDAAQRLAAETNGSSPHVSDATVQALIWFAHHISSVGTPGEPSLQIDMNPNDVVIPANLILPNWLQRVRSLDLDQDWYGYWYEGQQAPIPPSQRGGPTPSTEVIEVPPVTVTPTQTAPAPTQSSSTLSTTTTTTSVTTKPTGSSNWLLFGALGLVVIGGALVIADAQSQPEPRRSTKRSQYPRRG